jgi:hypothetical protein
MVPVQLIPRMTSRPFFYFLKGKDSISSFVRRCWIILFFLAIGAALIVLIGVANFLYFFLLGHLLIAVAVVALVFYLRYLDSYGFFDGWSPLLWIVPVSLLTITPFFYLMWIEPHAPLYLLGLLLAYSLLSGIYRFVERHIEGKPQMMRRLIIAAFRALAEVILLSAAGFGFVLMSQFYVLVLGAFNPDAIWIWEGIVKPLALLPHVTWQIAAWITFSLMALSLLNPRFQLVRRITSAVKIYKKSVALIAILASFTFLSVTCVQALEHDLFLRMRTRMDQPQPAKNTLQLVRGAAYISLRLKTANASVRSKLASEIASLDRTPDGIEEQALANHIAEEVNVLQESDFDISGGVATAGSSTTASAPPQAAGANGCDAGPANAPFDFNRIYPECRRAVASTLEDIVKQEGIHRLHTDSILFDSLADALLGSAIPVVLDQVLPENLHDFNSVRQWLSRHLRPNALANLLNFQVPERNRVLEQVGIDLPPISVVPKFHPGPSRPGSHKPLPPPEPPPLIP